MPWDWNWISSLITAALSPVVAIVAIIWSARTARQANAYDRNRRIEERKASAYLEIAAFADRTGTQASAVRPFPPTRHLDYRPPALPSLEEQALAGARASLYGSEEVKSLYGEWNRAVENLRASDHTIGFGLTPEGKRAGVNSDKVWQGIEPKRRAERDARRILIEQMGHELAGPAGSS